MREYWKCPEKRKRRSEQVKRYFDDPKHRQKLVDGNHKFWTPEQNEKHRREYCDRYSQPVVDGLGDVYPSMSECARSYGLDRRSIGDISCGDRQRNKGYSFVTPLLVEKITGDVGQIDDIKKRQEAILVYKLSDGRYFLAIKTLAKAIGSSAYLVRKAIREGSIVNGLSIEVVSSTEFLRHIQATQSKNIKESD